MRKHSIMFLLIRKKIIFYIFNWPTSCAYSCDIYTKLPIPCYARDALRMLTVWRDLNIFWLQTFCKQWPVELLSKAFEGVADFSPHPQSKCTEDSHCKKFAIRKNKKLRQTVNIFIVGPFCTSTASQSVSMLGKPSINICWHFVILGPH